MIKWKNKTITVTKKLKEIELHKRAFERASGFFLIRPLPFQYRNWTQLQIYEYLAINVSQRYEDLTPSQLMSEILELTNQFKSFLNDGKELGEKE